MKSNEITIGILLLLIGTTFFPVTAQISSVEFSSGNWFYVGGNGLGNYTEIQDAIDDASDGDTIFVYNGTYIGYVVINKAITLLGQEKNSTIINGYFAFTISIVVDSVSLSGFTIFNNATRGEGVRIDSSNNIISNTIIDIPNDRIRLYGHNNTFAGNTIENTYLFVSGDDNLITNNVFSNTYPNPFTDDIYGIYLMDGWDNIIAQNSFFNSGVYISLENICDNTVTDNIVNNKPLLYYSDQANLILDDPAGQIILVNCTNISIQNQEIMNTTVGIQIIQSSSCVISSNALLGNQYGICLNGWNNLLLTNNISNNYFGLELSGHNNAVYRNTLSTNREGIYFDDTDNNTLLDNIIISNQKSFLLDYGSDSNNIFNNTILYNTEAIQISGDRNHITGNIIEHNNDHGLLLISSDNNYIEKNRITSNKGDGLLVSNCNHNTIIKNIITNQSHDGIDLLGDNACISENTIMTNDENGINIKGDNATISANIIMNNTKTGIVLQGELNNISANTITNNENGISISNSKFNTLTGNVLSENHETGINLNTSSYTNISLNTIAKNKQGLSLIFSGKNTILHNNFQRNKRDGLFENCTNKWDQNYWERPRILPKIIFGRQEIQNGWRIPLMDFDWHPALKPYID